MYTQPSSQEDEGDIPTESEVTTVFWWWNDIHDILTSSLFTMWTLKNKILLDGNDEDDDDVDVDDEDDDDALTVMMSASLNLQIRDRPA